MVEVPASPLFVDVIECKLRVAHDNREHVVEFMGNASRERADGLHLLGLAEPFVSLPGRGDIEVDLHDCRRIPGVIPLEGLAAQNGNFTAVFRGVLQFSLPLAVARKSRHPVVARRGGFRLEQTVDRGAFGLIARPAVHLFGAVVPESDPVLHVDNDDGVVGQFEHSA